MNVMDLQDCIVVFDIDGVLSRYDFGELGFKLISEPGWVRANIETDIYQFTTKTSLFDELINSKNSMDMYVLSVASSSYEQANKVRFIEENYSNIREDNIIFVARTSYKIEVLKYLRDLYDMHGKKHKRIIMIEDAVSVLDDVETLANDGIGCYLVSDFI